MKAPLLLGTWSFALKGIERALDPLRAGGDPLDACETICSTAERDETVDSVGYGGFPDASGAVTLDASVMRSPARNGSACCIRHHLDATRIARLVMEETPHMMLVGHPTDALAMAHGLPESDLLAPSARRAWLQWQRDPGSVKQAPDTSFRPHDGGPEAAGPLFTGGPSSTGDEGDPEDRWRHHDTIGALAMAPDGEMAGACSTSGLPFKRPGRVGDSPIIGHGLYVEPGVGMAVATGEGEFIMGVCGTFAAIELMRGGATPLEAARVVLERVDATFAPTKDHQVGIITCSADGTHACAALRDGFRAVVGDSDGVRAVEPDLILHPGT
ncbi:MAG: isoaspartyl peptidase/L-asparaginase [Phycisphaerales bacterium]|nr:isoaspartyl peptidase/L-asparaginase [Phycisphaerales bacterium]